MKQADKKRIKDKISKGHCILGDCCKKFESLGLCRSHLNEFYHEKARRPKKEQAEFERKNIEAGRILKKGEQRELTKTSSFIE